MTRLFFITIFCLFHLQLTAGGTTYYVSSSLGQDSNSGTSEAAPFQSISHVNGLNLQPGDSVLFRCGDVWRAEMLVITRSGSAGSPITFGSYPTGCADKPTLSGAFPVSGWSLSSGNIYVADLNAGSNAGLFTGGVNQVFRNSDRLTLGRWPNPGEGENSDGYAVIDNPQSNGTTLVDNTLPAGDWSGAAAHIKGMRWFILNRMVTSSSGTTLNLNAATDCWAGSCFQWGYFLNNHLATLDRDGEWFYDENTGLLYLYSTSGTPSGIEASAIVGDTERSFGGIVLGEDLFAHISDVVIENLLVQRWYQHGITTPLNWQFDDNSNIVIRNNHILDVDASGINLAGWVWDPSNGIAGWRGGHNLTIENNWIRGAHEFGINSYAYNSTFEGNTLENIGLIETVGKNGQGCGFDTGGGFCTENGDGIRIKVDNETQSGFGNTLRENRLTRIGYNGIDVFGRDNTLVNNVIQEATWSKSDGGAIRTYGFGSIGATPVSNINIDGNIILDPVGNTDGANPTWRSHFGFGVYIDHFSENVTVTNNTVVNATASGILYQDSTGNVTNNTVFSSSFGTDWSAGILISTTVSSVGNLAGNVFYAQHANSWSLRVDNPGSLLASDQNYLFNPYHPLHILSNNTDFTLASWRTFSGMDGNSRENWFDIAGGDPTRGQIFYNDTDTTRTVNLGGSLYSDLDQNPVSGSMDLAPFSSRVLVLESACNPTATLSGGGTVCQGESVALNVTLTGTPPFNLTWNDGVETNGVGTMSTTRLVTPDSSTTYTLLSMEDAVCTGTVAGSAPVTVATDEPLGVTPPAAAQGEGPLTLTAGFPCNLDPVIYQWFDNGTLIATDTNPLVHEFTQPGLHELTLSITSNSGTETVTTPILVPNNPTIIIDPNGDDCHDLSDLYHHLPAWPRESDVDPDGNGEWDIRDYLYINTGQGYPACVDDLEPLQ